MPIAVEKQTVTIALIGNPNTGKSTLFSALSGVRQRIGNYPGVTVEKRVGRMHVDGCRFDLVDLPGTYSLAPRSPDEMIAVDVLLGRQAGVTPPDAVLCIVDAANLERNLYLVSQVLEMGLPTVVALNMIDAAEEKGVSIDIERLRKQLGVPIVATQAHRRRGLVELKQALAAAAAGAQPPAPPSPFSAAFQQEVEAIQHRAGNGEPLPRYLAERLLLDTSGYLEREAVHGGPELHRRIASARERLAAAGSPVPAVEAISRYQWVGEVLQGVIERDSGRRVTLSDRVDRILTHKLWGSLAFIAVMVFLFQAVFYVAEPASMAIEWLTAILAAGVESVVAEGALRSLLIDGVIAGVGGVLVFLPQIFTLFLFIALLEDCGYMARAAYLMDKLMSRVGLSGKSFIPLLSSFACAIPGIMAARVIENRRDRLVTILVAPLMSCSARLPVYVLLIAAFIPNLLLGVEIPLPAWPLLPRSLPLGIGLQGVTMFAMYSIGIVTAILVAWVLKKTILKGETPPFVMELPGYKIPSAGVVAHRVLDRGWAFVRRAGTLIFAVTVVVWAAAYYPRQETAEIKRLKTAVESIVQKIERNEQQAAEADGAEKRRLAEESRELDVELAAARNRVQSTYLKESFLGQAGQLIEPAVAPLGWDWRIGCAAIASFPAREVIVATLGVIYELGDEQDEESDELKTTLQREFAETGRPQIPVALSIMVFFALCAQCASTLAVMRRETNSFRWPIFTFFYMTTLAYLAAMATYQIGALVAGLLA